jgi:hypothetical protein
VRTDGIPVGYFPALEQLTSLVDGKQPVIGPGWIPPEQDGMIPTVRSMGFRKGAGERIRVTVIGWRARLSWRSPTRLSRWRSVRRTTPDRGGAGQHRERGLAVDASGVWPGQQDLGGAQCA